MTSLLTCAALKLHVLGELLSAVVTQRVKATEAYISASTDAGAALAPLLSGETKVRHCMAIRPKIMARYEEAAAALGWLL